MFVKIMGPEFLADCSTAKTFRLLADVTSAEFVRYDEDNPAVKIGYRDGSGESFTITGNVYILNDQGKTIETFAFSPKVSA